jgi:hypothetical protein
MDGEFLDVENQTGNGGLAHWQQILLRFVEIGNEVLS